jgi:bile acid:Na+ symporter, BASS family
MKSRILLGISILSFVAAGVGWMTSSDRALYFGVPLILGFAILAVSAQYIAPLKGLRFTFWVFAFVAWSMSYPSHFINWDGFELKRLIVPLIQVIMFGMGTSLSLADFRRALQKPKAVGVCVAIHFTVMPLTGLTLATLFGFPKEVAAGVILIGSCSSGVASNVMVYLARGSVALSVTMTTASTLMAPVMTPLAMKLLAGQYVPIHFTDMMMEILWMIVAPVFGGLLFNKLLHGKIAWLDRIMPAISMFSICFIIAIITSLSRDMLLKVGALLIGAAMIHNMVGYVMGYWGSRLLGLSVRDARTVSFETGLQNGGMASGLAINVLQSPAAALAPAIFGPWMNISGSALASYWRGKPTGEELTEEERAADEFAVKKPH